MRQQRKAVAGGLERERPGHDQHGSGTALVAGAVVVLMAVAAAVLVVGGYLVAAARARGAADLVALSAAARVAQWGDGCRTAADLARRNGVTLVRCAVRGDSLDFVVSVTVRQPAGLRPPLLPDGVLVTSHAGRLGVIGRG
jgi:secretion/DNA translocation related TadE-like protein